MSGCQEGGVVPPITQESVELQVLPVVPENTEHVNAHERKPLPLLLDFLKGVVSSIGIGSDTVPWQIAILLSLWFAVLYWGVAYGSLYFITHDYASFWAPNGVFAGTLLRVSPRARRLSLITICISIYTVNLVFGNSRLMSLYYVIVNTAESLIVVSLSLGLVQVLLPVKLSLLHREHLVSVGFGIVVGCGISSNLITSFAKWKLNPPNSYGMTYLAYLGRNLVGNALVAPLIISVPFPIQIRDLPSVCMVTLRTKTRLVVEALCIILILMSVPTVSAFIVSGSALSTVAGLYVTYPAVLCASAKFGLVGASGASLIVGLASATSTLVWSHDDPFLGPSSKSLSPQDQFVWIHLFLVVLVTTSLFFVIILAERDQARTSIEHEVLLRTEELVVANNKLDEALLKAETADNDKAVFFSFLCHELRNPLHVISHMANSLEESHGTRMPEIKAIKSSSKYMLALVSDVLDLGRFEAGRVILETLTVDIHALLESNLGCAAQMAATHQILFESFVDPTIPQWLSVDAIRLQQIFNNFVSNAFKFTPKGGSIRVEVRALDFFRGLNPLAAADPYPTSLSCRDALLRRQRSASITLSPPDDDVIAGPSHNPAQAVHLKSMMQKSKRVKWRKWMRQRRSKGGRGTGATEGPIVVGPVLAPINGPDIVGSSTGGVGESTTVTISPGPPLLVHTESAISRISSYDSNYSEYFANSSLRKHYAEDNSNLASSAEIHTSTLLDTTETYPPTRTTSDSSVASGVLEDRRASDGREGEESREREGEWVMLEVSVADTGIGIDPSIVSKLFRPYAQAAVSTMREYGGSGLGLAITNQIVRLMGGTVNVETEVGKGSKFTFTVPLAIVSSSSKTSEPCPPPEILYPMSPTNRQPSPIVLRTPTKLKVPDTAPSSETTTTTTTSSAVDASVKSEVPASLPHEEVEHKLFKILVVDDSGINRSIIMSMISRILVKGLYSIDIAVNGQEAVDKCQSNKDSEEFDLIFMDIVMPIMDGMEACRQIRANGYSKYIVITTANQVTGAEAIKAMTTAGASEAISKPFSKSHILNILTKYGASFAVKPDL